MHNIYPWVEQKMMMFEPVCVLEEIIIAVFVLTVLLLAALRLLVAAPLLSQLQFLFKILLMHYYLRIPTGRRRLITIYRLK